MKMNIDEELRLTVIDALRANMMIDASEIGVAVEQHVATLTGKVGGYYQKQAAEKTTRRVSGIRGVAEKLEVVLPGPHKRSDTEIAQAAANALLWNAIVPEDVKVTVEKGWLKLTGKTEWSYQRQAAHNAVNTLTGVLGVTNEIEVTQSTPSSTIKSQIEDTLRLASERDAKRISVENKNGVVTLKGTVRSWSERNDASRTAWNAPGVSMVENLLEIGA
jgi:osmotically-inducible protein OsmY